MPKQPICSNSTHKSTELVEHNESDAAHSSRVKQVPLRAAQKQPQEGCLRIYDMLLKFEQCEQLLCIDLTSKGCLAL